MNYDHFTAFTEKAPIVVDWLTELGKYLDQQFPKLAGMNFEEDEDHRPVSHSGQQRRKSKSTCHSCIF